MTTDKNRTTILFDDKRETIKNKNLRFLVSARDNERIDAIECEQVRKASRNALSKFELTGVQFFDSRQSSVELSCGKVLWWRAKKCFNDFAEKRAVPLSVTSRAVTEENALQATASNPTYMRTCLTPGFTLLGDTDLASKRCTQRKWRYEKSRV